MLKKILIIAIWLPPILINLTSLSGNYKLTLTGLYAATLIIVALTQRLSKCRICGKSRLDRRKIRSLLKFIFVKPQTGYACKNHNNSMDTQQKKCQNYATMEQKRFHMQLSLIIFLSFLALYDNILHTLDFEITFFIFNILILFQFYHGVITMKCPLCKGSLFWDSYSWKTQFFMLNFLLLIPHVECPYCNQNIFKTNSDNNKPQPPKENA